MRIAPGSSFTPRSRVAWGIIRRSIGKRNVSSKRRTAPREFSAGGVVVRAPARTDPPGSLGDVIVIVPIRRDPNGNRVLGLPKGHPNDDESPEQAAAREVTEETGVTAELIDELGDISYTYERRGSRITKRVSFYLFRYRDGDVADHDHEIEEARWMPLAQAAHDLTYEGEREIVARALSRLRADL